MNFVQQPRTYIYILDVLYSVLAPTRTHSHLRPLTVSCASKIFFISATKEVYILPSCTSLAVNNAYIRPHKVTFYRCLVVGYIFLWLLSYIYKPLDIMEIMSNCNTYNQGRIYTSILQAFSNTLVAEVYIKIHMLQRKKFACVRQTKTVDGIAL